MRVIGRITSAGSHRVIQRSRVSGFDVDVNGDELADAVDVEMSIGLAPQVPPAPQRDLVRVLWRLRGATKVTSACVYRTAAGMELSIEWSIDDIFLTEFFPDECAQLKARADELRRVLLDKGWSEVSDAADR